MMHTGVLVLNSALGDSRKLSPGRNLPTELPDNNKTSWWHLNCGWENTAVTRTFSVYGRLTTHELPPLPDVVMLPEPVMDAVRLALDESEDATLSRAAEGIAPDRAGIPDHRLRNRPDNRVAARARQEFQVRHPKRGKGFGQSKPLIRNPGLPSRGDDRRVRVELARLAAVHEDRPLDACHSSEGGGKGLAERISDGRRFPSASPARAVLRENGPTLQNRINELETELDEEKSRRRRAEARPSHPG
jgi:hypothetical protein